MLNLTIYLTQNPANGLHLCPPLLATAVVFHYTTMANQFPRPTSIGPFADFSYPLHINNDQLAANLHQPILDDQ
jgi:hypothetical protein